jgi:hypothetical protein
MFKKWFIICSIILTIFFAVVGGFSFGTVILGVITGTLAAATIVSTKSKIETNKRRNQKYPLAQSISIDHLFELVNKNFKHNSLVDIKKESNNSVVVTTKKCTYKLSISGPELTIYENIQTSKMIIYKLLFRPAPPIILANEARVVVPHLYNVVNSTAAETNIA